MAEMIPVLLGQDDEFDKTVHSGLPEGGDLRIITKDHATEGGRAAAVITFTVQLPDGSLRLVQAVTTVRLLVFALACLKGRYGDDGIVRTFDKTN